jgi:hypothetical protein
MTLRCLLALIVLGLCAPLACAQAGAGMQMDPLANGDVIVGTVKEVSADDATNGHPASVTVEITETLKGELKGTVVVIWGGRSHGVDTGPSAKNPIVIKWAAEKAEKPRVGDAYILFGRLNHPPGRDARLYTNPGGRMLVTVENRDKALNAIKFYDDQTKAEMDRRAFEAARQDVWVKQWRAGMTDEKLAAAIKEADFVALGKVSGNITFQVTEMLKGRKRMSYTDGSYFVQFKATKEMAALIVRERSVASMMHRGETEYLLLLSEKGLVLGYSSLQYQPVGDGVVLADAATIDLARKATQGLAGKAPPGVLVYPSDPKLADALETAAGGKVTVIRGSGLTGALAMDRVITITGVQADFLLCITKGRAPRATKPSVKLELARSDAIQTLLVNTTLVDPDDKTLAAQAPDIIAAILKAK